VASIPHVPVSQIKGCLCRFRGVHGTGGLTAIALWCRFFTYFATGGYTKLGPDQLKFPQVWIEPANVADVGNVFLSGCRTRTGSKPQSPRRSGKGARRSIEAELLIAPLQIPLRSCRMRPGSVGRCVNATHRPQNPVKPAGHAVEISQAFFTCAFTLAQLALCAAAIFLCTASEPGTVAGLYRSIAQIR